MEQYSSQVDALQCFLNDLYEQERKHVLLLDPFKDVSGTTEEDENSNFLKTLFLQAN